MPDVMSIATMSNKVWSQLIFLPFLIIIHPTALLGKTHQPFVIQIFFLKWMFHNMRANRSRTPISPEGQLRISLFSITGQLKLFFLVGFFCFCLLAVCEQQREKPRGRRERRRLTECFYKTVSKIVPGEILLGYLTIILSLQHLCGAQHVSLNCETRYSHSASFGG